MMGIKKSLVYLMMATVLLLGTESSADNAAIVQAIKANPALLDSPQAKAMMQDAKAPVVTTQVKAEVPINDVVQEIKTEENSPAPILNGNGDVGSFYRSPLSLEKNDDYSKRLIARQIKESPKTLKRYGIEFFSNKNGMDLASLPVPENYKLVPKDVLNVILYGPKSDNMSLTIDKEGAVVIPSFGPLQIAGLSFAEAKKTISDALMAAYPNVGVTVNITQFSSIQVTLAGEVAVPGIYNVSSFSTVKEALISAGGLSANGSMRSVSIKRQGRTYATIDLYSIIRGTGRSDPLLRAGDIIIVPIMGKSVVIDGDVKRPAIYEAKQNTSIANLIYYAGGIRASASKNDIRITRYEGHQGMKIFNVSLAESEKMVAQDQDKVYVHDLDKSNLRGITLYGNVIKPGFWPLSKEGMSVQEFFKREVALNTLRGVFLEQTYFDYAIIKRTDRNLKEEIIGFSLDKALKGEEKILLKNRDELYILNASAVETSPVVKISGECIARPGEYRYFDKMTMDALLATAGTVCPIDRSKVTIVSPDAVNMTMNVSVVNLDQQKVLPLKAFDDIRTVGYFTTNPIKEATITGEVYKPGTYPIADENNTLAQFILASGGLKKEAFLQRARIVRTTIEEGKEYKTKEFFVSLHDLSNEAAAFVLKERDVITIYNIDQVSNRMVASINGEVYSPGTFKINAKTTLKEMILAAGGLTEKASQDKIEIVRYEIVNGVRTRKVEVTTPQIAMSEKSHIIAPYDEVTIFRIPKWNERKSVKLVGKVKYPGEYAIEEGDKLSDVIRRAGGYTDAAYINSAVFTREEIKKRQQEGMERQIKDLEQRIMFISTQPSEAGQTASDKSQLFNMIGRLKEYVSKTQFVGRLALHLDADLQRFAGTNSDLILKNGDALYVPEREDSVMIQGEVLNPNAIIYNASFDTEDYLKKAGGLKNSADESNIFIVHSNGEAEMASSGFFAGNADVGPGDVIVVPMQIATFSGIQFAKDITAILYQLAVSAAALTTIGAL